MHDPIIRESIHRTLLSKYHCDGDSLVIEELGINHGSIRADIAVINGALHGYEIKGELDNLKRLPAQVHAYSEIFDKATLVVCEKHLLKAIELVPTWWGISVIKTSKAGKITFKQLKKSATNESVNPHVLVKLLWRAEAFELLKELEGKKASSKACRADLYKEIAENYSTKALQAYVRTTLKKRQAWRDHSRLLSYGDYSKLQSTS